MTPDVLPPLHPGAYLREELLAPLAITPYRLALDLGVSRPAVNQLCRGKSAISPKMAALLGRYFGMTPGFWMNLQAQYDARIAAEDPEIRAAVEAVVPLAASV